MLENNGKVNFGIYILILNIINITVINQFSLCLTDELNGYNHDASPDARSPQGQSEVNTLLSFFLHF